MSIQETALYVPHNFQLPLEFLALLALIIQSLIMIPNNARFAQEAKNIIQPLKNVSAQNNILTLMEFNALLASIQLIGTKIQHNARSAQPVKFSILIL